MASTPEQTAPNPEELRVAIASGDPVQAMPALAKLRALPDSDNDSVVIPLLILGSKQQAFLVRSLSCSGLGYRRNEQGWQVLSRLLLVDDDPNVRAEAANALASYGVERSWPLLRDSFAKDDAWLVRCSILSALAEQPEINPAWLLDLGKQAIADADGTVRVSGAEILARVVREQAGDANGSEARALLQPLQQDADHRVVAAALNGLQP
jgi:HEAT repeat protein